MAPVGLRVPAQRDRAHSLDEAHAALRRASCGCRSSIRPAFTLGGHGGGFAHTPDELEAIVARGLRESPIGQVLLEESVAGWGEFELEVIRDRNDNVVIVCSIENVDPMGVHTGDSVTVAPAQTLSDREYQALRDAAATVIRAVGVETGGSNVQFALNRETGELVVIEMNPRVSRSSALASKATGYPIAKVATKLAIGYTLDEIPNDITGTTPASFEPTLDYVVVKLPRFAFEKFPGADDRPDHADEVGGRGDGHRPHASPRRGARRCARASWTGAPRTTGLGGRGRPGTASTSSMAACARATTPAALADRVDGAPLVPGRVGARRRTPSTSWHARRLDGARTRPSGGG